MQMTDFEIEMSFYWPASVLKHPHLIYKRVDAALVWQRGTEVMLLGLLILNIQESGSSQTFPDWICQDHESYSATLQNNALPEQWHSPAAQTQASVWRAAGPKVFPLKRDPWEERAQAAALVTDSSPRWKNWGETIKGQREVSPRV